MDKSNSYFLIINPLAGKRNFNSSWNSIQTILKAKNIQYSFEFTQGRKDEISLVNQAIKKGIRNIVVVGGDGTLHHTVNGIMAQRYTKSSDIKLGIIPIGTGNDWIKSYTIPNSIAKSIDIILQNKTDYQDVGKISYDGQVEYFNNMAGVGYNGYVVKKLKNLKKLGSIAYLLSGLQGLLFYKKSSYRIKILDEITNQKCLMILFGICQYSGGGMKMTRDADPKDGLLDITIAKDFSFFDLVLNLSKLYNGKIVHHKKVKTYKVQSLTVEELNTNKSLIEADGEIIGKGSVSVTVLPKALQVFIKS